MKTYRALFLSLMIAVMVVVAGCQSAEPVQEIAQPGTQAPVEPADSEPVGSAPVEAADSELAEAPGAQPGVGDFSGLNDSNLLAMGTVLLEGTGDAATPEQAAKLLPLWTVIQSGSLQGAAETDAVLKQVRGQMTEEQLSAIEAMALTQDDYQAWLQEQGIEIPALDGDGPPAGAPEGAGDMSEEDRAAMREQFQSMTEDERATAMAESGMERPEGGAGGPGDAAGGFGGSRVGNLALQPLIDLLTERAAE